MKNVPLLNTHNKGTIIAMITIFSFNYSYSQNSYRLIKSVGKSFFSIASRNNLNAKDIGDSAFRVIHVYDKKDKKAFSQKIVITCTSVKDSLLVRVVATEINDTTEINPINQATAKNIQRILLVNSANIKDESPIEDIYISNRSEDKNNGVSKLKDTLLRKIKDKPITVHGSINITGQLSDNKYTGQTIPQNYIRTQINSEVALFGAPFNMGYYYTTENNSELNRINNCRVSFNYEKFYSNLKKKLDDKISLDKNAQLLQLTKLNKININEINKEYGKLNSQLSAPDFAKQIQKYQTIIQKGESDSVFRKTYQFKKAEQQLLAYRKKLERMQEMAKLRELYLKDFRNVNVDAGVKSIKASNWGGFNKSIKQYGLFKPGYNYLLAVKKLDIGTFDPNYTTLILSGVSLTGINIEVNPGQVYGAFTWGTTVSNFANPFSKDVSGGRTILSARAGVGRTENILVSFSVLKGSDQSGNIVKDTNSTYYLPQHNYVVGADLRYRAGNNYDIGFEYARSMNEETSKETKNTTEQIGALVSPDRSKYSSAWTAFANGNISETGTKFHLMTRVVDPFFYSFGTPYMRRDNFRIETKAEQPFIKNQVSASMSYRRDEDNIYHLKEGTSINNALIFSLHLKFKNYPFVILTYSPNYQSTFNAVNKSQFSSTVKLYNITAGYTKQSKHIVATTIVNYTKQYNETNNGDLSLFHMDQYAFNENLYFKAIDLNLTSGITYALPFQGGDTGRIFIANISASENMFKSKMNITCSYAYQKDFAYEQRNIIQVGMGFSLGWNIKINILAEHHFIQSYRLTDISENTDINLGRITILKNF